MKNILRHANANLSLYMPNLSQQECFIFPKYYRILARDRETCDLCNQ